MRVLLVKGGYDSVERGALVIAFTERRRERGRPGSLQVSESEVHFLTQKSVGVLVALSQGLALEIGLLRCLTVAQELQSHCFVEVGEHTTVQHSATFVRAAQLRVSGQEQCLLCVSESCFPVLQC